MCAEYYTQILHSLKAQMCNNNYDLMLIKLTLMCPTSPLFYDKSLTALSLSACYQNLPVLKMEEKRMAKL